MKKIFSTSRSSSKSRSPPSERVEPPLMDELYKLGTTKLKAELDAVKQEDVTSPTSGEPSKFTPNDRIRRSPSPGAPSYESNVQMTWDVNRNNWNMTFNYEGARADFEVDDKGPIRPVQYGGLKSFPEKEELMSRATQVWITLKETRQGKDWINQYNSRARRAPKFFGDSNRPRFSRTPVDTEEDESDDNFQWLPHVYQTVSPKGRRSTRRVNMAAIAGDRDGRPVRTGIQDQASVFRDISDATNNSSRPE